MKENDLMDFIHELNSRRESVKKLLLAKRLENFKK